PVDEETLRYLRMTGRPAGHIALVEAYCKEQGLFHDSNTEPAEYSELLELDLSRVEPSIAGPKRPQDRVPLSEGRSSFENALPTLVHPGGSTKLPKAHAKEVGRLEGEGGVPAVAVAEPETQVSPAIGNGFHLQHGSIVIAAITSCTNTSNPSV